MWEQSCISPQKKKIYQPEFEMLSHTLAKKYIIMIPKLSHHCSITSHCHKVFGLPAEFGYNLTLHQKKTGQTLRLAIAQGPSQGGPSQGVRTSDGCVLAALHENCWQLSPTWNMFLWSAKIPKAPAINRPCNSFWRKVVRRCACLGQGIQKISQT